MTTIAAPAASNRAPWAPSPTGAVSAAGAMSCAELGLSLAETIRRDKIHGISCAGANLEEDVLNLVAHDFHEPVPYCRDLTPADEQAHLDRHMNRVTDTCIPEMEAMRRIETVVLEEWQKADARNARISLRAVSQVIAMGQGSLEMSPASGHWKCPRSRPRADRHAVPAFALRARASRRCTWRMTAWSQRARTAIGFALKGRGGDRLGRGGRGRSCDGPKARRDTTGRTANASAFTHAVTDRRQRGRKCQDPAP